MNRQGRSKAGRAAPGERPALAPRLTLATDLDEASGEPEAAAAAGDDDAAADGAQDAGDASTDNQQELDSEAPATRLVNRAVATPCRRRHTLLRSTNVYMSHYRYHYKVLHQSDAKILRGRYGASSIEAS